MAPKVSVQQRERELQALLATPEGRKQLADLEASYTADSRRMRPGKGSIITFILVHERAMGLIVN